MATRVIATDSQLMDRDELLRWYNEEAQANFSDLAEVAASVGMTTLTIALRHRVNAYVALGISAASALLTYASAIVFINNSLTQSDLHNTVEQMLDSGGSYFRVVTRYVEWSSGSGNHYTRYTEHDYSWF
ncbi:MULTISPECIES: hypothetical protein [Allobacillus]|uniref:Uncharacterized protein n=1 Tax=Allobacillus salarius TaxID=1955272 RepID=A0A556P8R9_9BACI|nr:hypothetical protein [Allobacillus salarius]TSJ60793.1 hypothetical protein FPQ13_11575 [Allobacillus salarius]